MQLLLDAVGPDESGETEMLQSCIPIGPGPATLFVRRARRLTSAELQFNSNTLATLESFLITGSNAHTSAD